MATRCPYCAVARGHCDIANGPGANNGITVLHVLLNMHVLCFPQTVLFQNLSVFISDTLFIFP